MFKLANRRAGACASAARVVKTNRRRGNAAVEYALLFSLFGVAAMGVFRLGSTAVSGSFSDVSASVAGAIEGDDVLDGSNRSGLGDDTNPGQGSGQGQSPNQGTDNPNQASGQGGSGQGGSGQN